MHSARALDTSWSNLAPNHDPSCIVRRTEPLAAHPDIFSQLGYDFQAFIDLARSTNACIVAQIGP